MKTNCRRFFKITTLIFLLFFQFPPSHPPLLSMISHSTQTQFQELHHLSLMLVLTDSCSSIFTPSAGPPRVFQLITNMALGTNNWNCTNNGKSQHWAGVRCRVVGEYRRLCKTNTATRLPQIQTTRD